MRYLIDGETVEIDSEDISYGEMQDATQALGVVLDSGDVLAIHGLNLWVAFRRLHPELSAVQITDKVRQVKFRALATAKDDRVPFGPNGDQETTPAASGIPG